MRSPRHYYQLLPSGSAKMRSKPRLLPGILRKSLLLLPLLLAWVRWLPPCNAITDQVVAARTIAHHRTPPQFAQRQLAEPHPLSSQPSQALRAASVQAARGWGHTASTGASGATRRVLRERARATGLRPAAVVSAAASAAAVELHEQLAVLWAMASRVALSGTVIIASFNAGYDEMVENWALHVQAVGLGGHFIIFAADHTALAFANSKWPGQAILLPLTGQFGREEKVPDFESAHFFADAGFHKVASHRAVYILHLLCFGFNVLYSDIDIAWAQNPLPYFTMEGSVGISRGRAEAEAKAKAEAAAKAKEEEEARAKAEAEAAAKAEAEAEAEAKAKDTGEVRTRARVKRRGGVEGRGVEAAAGAAGEALAADAVGGAGGGGDGKGGGGGGGGTSDDLERAAEVGEGGVEGAVAEAAATGREVGETTGEGGEGEAAKVGAEEAAGEAETEGGGEGEVGASEDGTSGGAEGAEAGEAVEGAAAGGEKRRLQDEAEGEEQREEVTEEQKRQPAERLPQEQQEQQQQQEQEEEEQQQQQQQQEEQPQQPKIEFEGGEEDEEDYDVYLTLDESILVNASDAAEPTSYYWNKKIYCSCFLYLRPTPGAKAFIANWAFRMAKTGRFGGLDQDQMRDVIAQMEGNNVDGKIVAPKIAVLPPNRFLSGQVLADNWTRYETLKPKVVTVHANYIAGRDAKRDRLRQAGFWRVEERRKEEVGRREVEGLTLDWEGEDWLKEYLLEVARKAQVVGGEGWVIVVAVCAGDGELFQNWLKGISLLGFGGRFVAAVAEEAVAASIPGFRNHLLPFPSHVPSANASRVCPALPALLAAQLMQAEQSTVISDVSTVWLKDPFPFFSPSYNLILPSFRDQTPSIIPPSSSSSSFALLPSSTSASSSSTTPSRADLPESVSAVAAATAVPNDAATTATTAPVSPQQLGFLSVWLIALRPSQPTKHFSLEWAHQAFSNHRRKAAEIGTDSQASGAAFPATSTGVSGASPSLQFRFGKLRTTGLQACMNRAIARMVEAGGEGATVGVLPVPLFPPGWLVVGNREWFEAQRGRLVAVHNNCGMESKHRARCFREMRLWMLDE